MVFVFVMFGCKGEEPNVAGDSGGAVSEDHSGHDHAAMVKEAAVKEVAAVTEQTTCPVMGGAINKDLFVEYKGTKVYFCCAGCEGTFNADPEKYLEKLPQFSE